MLKLKTKIIIAIENNLGQGVSLERDSELHLKMAHIDRCLGNTLSLSEREIEELSHKVINLYMEKTRGIRNILGDNFEDEWSENEQ